MKKVFILKSKNTITNEEEYLTTMAFKDYTYAVEYLKEAVIRTRIELRNEKYDENTDMTEILKGLIEVYETKKGQFSEIYNQSPIKTYNYNF